MSGRSKQQSPATEDDFKMGNAVFYIPDGRSRVYDLGQPLPLKARLRKDTEADQGTMPAGAAVEIIQCEIVNDEKDVIVGFRHEGGFGVCMLEEIELID